MSTADGFFSGDEPIIVARAPGRLDVMGGIADYSGSLVLQLPLDRHTVVTAQRQREPMLDVVSVREGAESVMRMTTEGILAVGSRSPRRLGEAFEHTPDAHWMSYIAGVALVVLKRLGPAAAASPLKGLRMRIESTVPEGKGVSSSAALEVASLAAIAAAYHVDMTSEEIALSSQWAENHVAGAPCGIMDQMTSACGRRDHLLRLRCQPARIEGHVAIPGGYRFFGIDSGVRHAVTGADYGTVRTAAFMGYRIIADLAQFPAVQKGELMRVDDRRWNGYLANIAPVEFVRDFEARLPEAMSGAEFIARYQGTTDSVTRVKPERTYPVRQATAHPIHENARVAEFANLLERLTSDPAAAQQMGQLMHASHESYGACGLGSEGTDRLVAMVTECGVEKGLFGAKITGGGSGGTVAILGRTDAESCVRQIARRYEEETGRFADVFAGSGAGLSYDTSTGDTH
ncbi:MAG: galactokinase family protein [Gemmatimonadota bacterium]